jgi:hypothetical protein
MDSSFNSGIQIMIRGKRNLAQNKLNLKDGESLDVSNYTSIGNISSDVQGTLTFNRVPWKRGPTEFIKQELDLSKLNCQRALSPKIRENSPTCEKTKSLKKSHL